jgi:small conductance mechanosensitive channel
VETLRRAVRFLERRGIEASAQRQAIVEATGEISEQLLDPEVLKGLAAVAWQRFLGWLRDNGPGLVVRSLILVGFVFLFRGLARLLWLVNRLNRFQRGSSRLLRDLLGRMLMPTASVLGLFCGLWFLGVDPRTLLAGVGVASIIIGLALQDSLGNLAAGAFILMYRPYDVDDTVRAAGEVGLVKAMGLANTTILTFDNRRLHVPNRKIWSDIIENRTTVTRRRVDTTLRIAYGEDVERVFAVIREALADSEIVLEEPEPLLFVSKLHDSWIEIEVRPWSSVENWWELYTMLPRLMLETLQAHDIKLPHRRQVVDVVSGRPPEESA